MAPTTIPDWDPVLPFGHILVLYNEIIWYDIKRENLTKDGMTEGVQGSACVNFIPFG